MATAKKGAAKKPAAKKGAKPKANVAKKRVGGRSVTVEVKSKGSKKALSSCERIDIGGGKVVDLCVMPKKPKEKAKEATPSPTSVLMQRRSRRLAESRKRKGLKRAALRPKPLSDAEAWMQQEAEFSKTLAKPKAAPEFSLSRMIEESKADFAKKAALKARPVSDDEEWMLAEAASMGDDEDWMRAEAASRTSTGPRSRIRRTRRTPR